jgi:hypothetical protein
MIMAQPNDALAVLIEEAGFSFAGLARRVNQLGKVNGLDLMYDYTAVHRWVVRGQRPRKPGVPKLIAQALSERRGRRVIPESIHGLAAVRDVATLRLAWVAMDGRPGRG